MASAGRQSSRSDHVAQRHLAAHQEERRARGVAAGQLQRVGRSVGLEDAGDLEGVVEGCRPALKPSSMFSFA